MTKKQCPLGEDCDRAKARIAALEDHLRGAVDECVRVGRLWHGAEAKLAKAVEAMSNLRQAIRESGVKRTACMYPAVLSFDAILAELKGDKT